MVTGDFDAAHRVANVQEAARLPALAVHGQRLPNDRLHAEAVQHCSENIVVVETVDQCLVERAFFWHRSVYDALIQICRPSSPDLAPKQRAVAARQSPGGIARTTL